MNRSSRKTSTLKYSLLLLLAAAIWGLGTVCMKGIVEEIPRSGWQEAASSRQASCCAPCSRRSFQGWHAKAGFDHLKASLILSVPMIAGYMANSLGLTDTTAAKSSFLAGLYCVIVPFIAWGLTRKRPTAFNISAALLCVVGVGLVSLAGQSDLTMGWGDAVTLLSSLLFAIQLAATSKMAPGRDMRAITALQFIFGGAIGLVVAAFVEQPPAMQAFADPSMIASLAYLVLGATCAALLLQNIGLAKVPAASR